MLRYPKGMGVMADIREWVQARLGVGGRMKRRTYRTMSGPMHVYEILYDDGKPVRVMNVKGTYQSATYLDDECYELVFGYHRAYNRLFEAGFPIRDMLMLGGGGFSYPEYVISHYPEVAVDVVEIDPEVIAIAQRWFYLDRLIVEFDTEETDRLGIYEYDARAFLEESDVTYDAIVNDCFDARIPVMSLATAEAARAIHARLNPGGLYLTNVISALKGPRAKLLHSVVTTLQGEFAHVHVVSGEEDVPRSVDNFVVIATDGDYRFSDTLDVRPPESTKPLVDKHIDAYKLEYFLKDA
jgi:spermidine synthase